VNQDFPTKLLSSEVKYG